MIPIEWIYRLHRVGSFGPASLEEDEYGGLDHDVFFTFSPDPEHFTIDVAWFRATGDIIPWPKRWRGNDVTQS